jgi:hypothetical protein
MMIALATIIIHEQDSIVIFTAAHDGDGLAALRLLKA